MVFGGGTKSILMYRVRSGESDDATHDAGRIEVVVRSAAVTEWANGTSEGIYFETGIGLRVAVEKDFRCLAPRDAEDDSDAFEHPGGPSASAV